MALILNIDTAQDCASVCLSRHNEVLELLTNDDRKDHAAWLHTAISELLKKNRLRINDLEAVSVTIGPGSYTGLRVGLSSAKGYCYALKIPLLAVSTLEVMAYSVREEAKSLICPMIDARRMEVFAAVYDKQLTELVRPTAMVLDETSFAHLLSGTNVIFCGSGSTKLHQFIDHPNASWSASKSTAAHLSIIAQQYFTQEKFANLAYEEPLYLKEFHSGRKAST